VSWFSMTPALSDDPFITFRLRAVREGPLRILLVNNRGQRFEASHPIRFS
jgi:sulfur-oxidizing protein SoxY